MDFSKCFEIFIWLSFIYLFNIFSYSLDFEHDLDRLRQSHDGET